MNPQPQKPVPAAGPHLAVFASVLMAACGPVSEVTHDNATMRARQERAVSAFSPRPIEGKSVREFFTDRTALITFDPKDIGGGRAVPVTRDGYCLTALHVVQEEPWWLLEMGAAPPFSQVCHKGRVVWESEHLDLALVKFPVEFAAPLPLAREPAEEGTSVFSGSSLGVFRATGPLHFKDLQVLKKRSVGNGSYATAGRISRTEKHGNGTIHTSTMPVRGGMSGGPVADEKGRLVGIVTEARWFLHPRIHSWSIFTMVDPIELERRIEEDRKIHESR